MKTKLLFLGLVVGVIGFSQISDGGLPTTFVKVVAGEQSPYDTYFQTVEAGVPNMATINAEDVASSQKGEKYRVGVNMPVNVNILSHGTWHVMPTGDRIWRVAVKTEGAQAVSLYFDEQVQIPLGGKLHAYNKKESQYVGAYTSNTPSFYSMELIQGDEIILEYFQPAGSDELPVINIGHIVHYYRGVEDRIAYFRDGFTQNLHRTHQSCQVDVECPSGTAWTEQIDAVVHYSFSEGAFTYVCTGSVVNNTNADCKPYILTANHCGEPTSNADISANTWYFNYQRPTCVPGNTSKYSGALSQTMSGGIFRASSSWGDEPAAFTYQVDGCDFVLVEMSTSIPTAYGAYYAGWSRATGTVSSGVGIHHPSGDEKKISTFSSSTASATYNSGWANAHWALVWSEGATEQGSSGSPLFDNNGRIIGHLSGGLSACTVGAGGAGTGPTESDLYGKFNRAWDQESASDPKARLENWLDPIDDNPTFLDGTYAPCTPAAPVADFVASATTVATGTTVTFTDLSSGSPTGWSWSITPGTGWSYTGGTSSTSENPQVNFTTVGTYTVELTASNGVGSDTETKTAYINVTSVVGPCAAAGNADCTSGTGNEHIAQVVLNTLDNSSGCSDYSDFTSMSTTLTKTSTYDVTVVPNTAGDVPPSAYNNDEIAVWIDFNDDNDFDDAGEQVGYVLISGTVSTTFNFTVPAGAVTGDVIMRTRISYSTVDGPIEPCGTTLWGEVEDYTITIDPAPSGSAPVANFSADATTVLPGTTVNFTDLSTNTPTSWSWNITPGTGWSYASGTSSSQDPSVNFATPGTYTVALTATNSFGSDTETKTNYITVTSNIGITENVSDFSIYPNPSNGLINIDLSKVNGDATEIIVTDVTGRIITNISNPELLTSIDLSNEAKGLYFVTVNTDNNSVTKKVTKL